MITLVSPNEHGILEHAGDRPNLGLLYLSAALKANGVKHRVFDLNHLDTGILLCDLSVVKPEVIGVTYLAPTELQMQQFIRQAKVMSPSTHFIAGGIQVTNKPGRTWADSEISGPGESALLNFLEDTSHFETFDINRYPIPNREAVDMKKYGYKLEGLPATTMITSRGCPNLCAFCSVPEKKQSRRSLDNIAEELDQIKSMGFQAVHFYDDSFAVSKEHAMRVTEQMAKRGLKYRVELRANHIDDELAKQLGQTGCLVAALGIESGDDYVLSRCSKSSNTDYARQAIMRLTLNGVKTKGFFMIGLPGETEDSARRTIQFADELKHLGLNYADFYPLMPFDGSPIKKTPEKYGIRILERDTTKYCNGGKELYVPTETEKLSQAKIKELLTEARSRWKS